MTGCSVVTIATAFVKCRCSRLSHDLCALIKDKVKQLQQHQQEDCRKLVVNVLVGEDVGETSVRFASRCLWDAAHDSMASVTYRNDSLYAVGVVFWLTS